MAELKKGTLNRKKQNGRNGVNANLDADESGGGDHRNLVSGAIFGDEVNDELLNEIGAVGNAGDEGGAGNSYSSERQTRAEDADQQRGHAKRDERKLPGRGGDSDFIGVAKIQGVTDRSQPG